MSPTIENEKPTVPLAHEFGGCYLQMLSGKDLYKQTIVVTSKDTFPVRFPNIFDYPLGQMRVGDKLWTNWNCNHGKHS